MLLVDYYISLLYIIIIYHSTTHKHVNHLSFCNVNTMGFFGIDRNRWDTQKNHGDDHGEKSRSTTLLRL